MVEKIKNYFIKKNKIKSFEKYHRLTNYLSVSQIYLKNNFLLKKSLKNEDIKCRLLGHFGTTPGINFVYIFINYLINKHNKDFIFVLGPGHGFPAIQSNLFLESSLSHFFPKKIPYNYDGFCEIIKHFSTPYGYPSHSNPGAPGTILEGGELGYSLSIAYGSVLDNPNLITICLIGDGESETGPLSGSWNINKVFPKKTSGKILPILHLNGYKISGPTIFGRMSNKKIEKFFSSMDYEVFIVDYNFSENIYYQMKKAMEVSYDLLNKNYKKIPIIIMRTKKGWSGPKYFDGKRLEDNCLSHQVPLSNITKNKKELKQLEEWLKSYKIENLISFSKNKKIILDEDIKKLIPKKPMGKNNFWQGGKICKKLNLEKLNYKLDMKKKYSSMEFFGEYLSNIFKNNKGNFRIFSPDETYSNKIGAVFKNTNRVFNEEIKFFDIDYKKEKGGVIEMLNEHNMFGLLHGYCVSGKWGIFITYESFAGIVSSMTDQFLKFLKASQEFDFRKPLPALNICLTSLLERQDHNGFSHQNPSYICSLFRKR